VKPLVVAISTASRRNSSVYLVAIQYLLHSKRCSKETGTKTGQDHKQRELCANTTRSGLEHVVILIVLVSLFCAR
jgi:hypothetical protein